MKIIMLFILGILFCAEMSHYFGFFWTVMTIVMFVASVIYAFIALPLWDAISWVAFWLVPPALILTVGRLIVQWQDKKKERQRAERARKRAERQ